MTAYNNAMPRHNGLSSSSMFFSNTPSSPPNNGSYQPSPFILNRQSVQHSSSEPNHYTRASIAQSVIFPPKSQLRSNFNGLSKLETMARHVNTPLNEDPPIYKHNSSEKTPFSRCGFPNREDYPSTGQVLTPKPFYSYGNMEEENKIGTEPYEGEPRKRRQSVDLDLIARKGGPISQKFKFMQRAQQFQPNQLHQNKISQKNDCQSTNSGSGNQLLKPKQYDFLKKKQQTKDDNGNQTGNSFQLIPPFKPLVKSSQIWPLSISPIQQKIPKPFQTQKTHTQQSSTVKPETHHLSPPGQLSQGSHSPINAQFKKRIFFQNRPISQYQVPQNSPPTPNRPQQFTRFNPMKCSTTDIKMNEKEQLLRKSKGSAKVQRQITINDFEIINKLGKGAFGQVFVAQQKILGFVCVIKKMSKKRIREAKVEEHITRQIKLQSYLNHGHITSLYGYFHDEQHLYLILELLPDGSLQQVKKRKKLPEQQAVQIVRQVAIGLKYMHQECVIHRDLKPENLFLNQGYVKIGDLGCSIYHNQTGLRNTIVGCLEYSSPQQLSKEGYTQKIDSWSLGIMTYELLFGKSPFESDIKKMVMCGDDKTELSEVSFPSAPVVAEQTKKFILNLLNRDPDRRMDMDEVLHHPFLKQLQK